MRLGEAPLDTVRADIRYAIRVLINAKGFTLIAILTLALGIGANTAMFSVVNAILLRPLPFHDPDQLVALGNYNTERPLPEIARGSLSYPDFLDVRARTHAFQEVAAYTGSEARTLTGLGDPFRVNTAQVTANIFPLLGVQAALGRTFTDAEDEAHHHVAIISNKFWRAHFNADRNVLSRTISLNGVRFEIIGVMPAGMQWPIQADAQDLWTTFSENAETEDPKDKPMTQQRGSHWIDGIARMKPGVTLAQANADLLGVSKQLASEFPIANKHNGIAASQQISYLVGDSKEPLIILFVAVGLVLLIACANIANLMLARSSGRTREMAVRTALGATRFRIVRQLVTESLVLASVGGALGYCLAGWSVAAVLRLYPANLPRAQEIGLDSHALIFTAGLAIITGVLFGLVPAMQVSAPDLTEQMRSGNTTATAAPRQLFLRNALVVGEITIGIVLLIGAGLLMRSLQKLSRVDLGFSPDHVLTAAYDLNSARYKADEMNRFTTELVNRIRALPGVVNASGGMPIPLSDDNWSVTFDSADHPLPESERASAGFYDVQPGFFETMRIPLLRGRTFDDEHDSRNGKPSVIVSQSFAEKYFPNENPIGKILTIGAGEGEARARYKTREIVGVVGDIRKTDLTKAPIPSYYLPLPQLTWGPPILVVRTQNDPKLLVNAINKTVLAMDPESPLHQIETMDDYLALALGRARFQATLLAIFAGVALLLTAIGLYGVIAYAVGQRTHEIGIRMALGASRHQVLTMVLNRGFVLTLTGIGLGLGSALLLAKFIAALLYEIPPRDPVTYLVVAMVLGCVALFASYIPALRATKVDPVIALRYD